MTKVVTHQQEPNWDEAGEIREPDRREIREAAFLVRSLNEIGDDDDKKIRLLSFILRNYIIMLEETEDSNRELREKLRAERHRKKIERK